MESIYLSQQFIEGWPLTVGAVLIGLFILLTVVFTRKMAGSDPAAYYAMSFFLAMFLTMIIVGIIFKQTVVIVLGAILGAIVSTFLIVFATKWSKEG